jgi:hypothetical protein
LASAVSLKRMTLAHFARQSSRAVMDQVGLVEGPLREVGSDSSKDHLNPALDWVRGLAWASPLELAPFPMGLRR